jgi:hypothetical protein
MRDQVRQHSAFAEAGLTQHNQRPLGAFDRRTSQRPYPADLG